MSVLKTAIIACRSAAAYAFLALYGLIVGPFALAAVSFTRKPAFLFAPGLLGIRTALRIAGVRGRLVGVEQLPRSCAAVYCINHTSNLDVLVFSLLYAQCTNLRILYKAELQRVPIIGPVFSSAGFVPVPRGDHQRAIEALDHAAAALRAGDSFLVAPEGTRSRDGHLLPFKKGVFVMALRAQAPIVPVLVRGARNCLPKGSWMILPGEITAQVLRPVQTAGLSYAERDRLIDTVHTIMEGSRVAAV
jgi:1-acyl-sn-glycerol-3-phosphate acyltransferase